MSLVDLWAVREVIDDTLCTFHPFHTETARALFALDDSLRFPSFVFIAEVCKHASLRVLSCVTGDGRVPACEGPLSVCCIDGWG